MSNCRKCSQPITWLQRPNGLYYPPFNYSAAVEIDDWSLSVNESGELVAKPNVESNWEVKLTRHICSIRDVKEKDESDETNNYYINKGVQIGLQQAKEHQRPLERVKIITLAVKLSFQCQTCEAKPFDWCTYVGKPDKFTKNLHVKR